MEGSHLSLDMGQSIHFNMHYTTVRSMIHTLHCIFQVPKKQTYFIYIYYMLTISPSQCEQSALTVNAMHDSETSDLTFVKPILPFILRVSFWLQQVLPACSEQK